MKIIKRLKGSAAAKTTAASYVAFASNGLWGLATISVAVSYLSPGELGLWTIVSAFLSYLVWLDLGVGPATGRLMGKAIAERDANEINQWWTATRCVLWCQCIVVIVLGISATPLIHNLLKIDPSLAKEANWLLIGGAIITGFSLPIRSTAGFLTAQNRFYWIPFIQIFLPWINLAAFYLCLRQGWGVKSFLVATAISQGVCWICYQLLIRRSPDRPRLDKQGISPPRLKKLLSFSGNLTIVGFSEAIIRTLPAMLIARFGSVSMVPIYNFSWKGPLLLLGLIKRTYQSFYAPMQRMYLKGDLDAFALKYRDVGKMSLAVSLLAASCVLAFNTSLVQLVAGEGFFIGNDTNTWFAMGMLAFPLAGYFRILLLISGSLGKDALIVILKLILGIVCSTILWEPFGMLGIAVIFSLLPMISAWYASQRGAHTCGFRLDQLVGEVARLAIMGMGLVLACGYFIEKCTSSSTVMNISGRSVEIPSGSALGIAFLPAIPGLLLLFKSLKSMTQKIAT